MSRIKSRVEGKKSRVKSKKSRVTEKVEGHKYTLGVQGINSKATQ